MLYSELDINKNTSRVASATHRAETCHERLLGGGGGGGRGKEVV